MSLIAESLRYAKKQPFFGLFVVLTFINDIIVGLVISDLMYRVSKGSTAIIPYIIFLKLSNTILDIVNKRIVTHITKGIELDFRRDGLEKYDTMSFKSKNKSPASSFWQKLGNATWPMNSIMEWGIPTGCGLVGTFVGCIWTFFRLGLLVELISVVIISSLIWFFYIRNQQKLLSKFHKKFRSQSDELIEKIHLLLPGFQNNEVPISELNRHDRTVTKNGFEYQFKWSQNMMYSTMMNEFTVLVISYCTMTDHSKYMLVAIVLGNLSSAVTSLNHFLNQYNKLENEFYSYTSFWKDLEFIKKPVAFPFQKAIEVTNVNIDNGGFQVKLDPSIKTLSYGPGNKILIKGPTGHGKSTFINGLTGKIAGVEMSYGKPENYYHTTTEMYQNIREKTPSSKITLRDYFHGELDDGMIMKCLEPCFEKDELDQLFESLRKENQKNHQEDDIEAQLKAKHPFDCHLNEIPSGGQKSRLCIATRVYDMDKNGKKILILDEPEQGSDPDTAVRVLQNVCNMFDTITVVTHMCNCQLGKLGVKWTHQLEIENGIVKEKKFV